MFYGVWVFLPKIISICLCSNWPPRHCTNTLHLLEVPCIHQAARTPVVTIPTESEILFINSLILLFHVFRDPKERECVTLETTRTLSVIPSNPAICAVRRSVSKISEDMTPDVLWHLNGRKGQIDPRVSQIHFFPLFNETQTLPCPLKKKLIHPHFDFFFCSTCPLWLFW